MSIVKALNELSGKEANTIEKAIRNIDLGGGGGGKFVVHFSSDSESPEKIVADKTIDEIIEAKNSGKDVVGDFDDFYGLDLEIAMADEGYKYAVFIKMLGSTDGTSEKLRSIKMMTIAMLEYKGEEPEITWASPTGKFTDGPLSVEFYYNDSTGVYTFYGDKNEVASAISNRDPINANLYGTGGNSHLNYCTDSNSHMQFYWITYSTSALTFHSLSSGMYDESGWEHFEKNITFDA